MAELKPCPFCGRVPNTQGCGEYGYFVVCDCGIEQSRIYKQKCDAVKHWNRRKTEPTISKMEQVDKDINVRSKDEEYINNLPWTEVGNGEQTEREGE